MYRKIILRLLPRKIAITRERKLMIYSVYAYVDSVWRYLYVHISLIMEKMYLCGC